MKKLLKWLENYWYHYKWHTLIGAFFAVILVVGIVQMSNKSDPDISFLYVGPEVVSDEAMAEMEKTFATVVENDSNQDGEKLVDMTKIVILSDEQIKEKEEEAAEEDDTLYYDVSLRNQAFDQAKSWLVVGEMPICLMDPYVYEIFAAQNLFLPLESVFEEVPACAYDAYGIRFSETTFGSFYSSLEPIAENTVLCLVKPTFLGDDAESERYQTHVAFFKAIVDFSIE